MSQAVIEREEAIKTVAIGSDEIQLWDLGEGDPILFLHGFEGLWSPTPFLRALAASHRVIAPVQAGFSDSSRLNWVSSMDDVPFVHRAVIEQHLDGTPVSLVGHSLGGWMAAEFAVRFSHLLDSLVLISAFGLLHPERPRRDIFMLDETAFASICCAEQGQLAQDIAAGVYDVNNRATSAQLAWAPRLFGPRLADRLRWVDVPALVVWGERDAILDPLHAEQFAALIPTAETSVLENAGHYAHLEDPEVAALEVLRFLGTSSKEN